MLKYLCDLKYNIFMEGFMRGKKGFVKKILIGFALALFLVSSNYEKFALANDIDNSIGQELLNIDVDSLDIIPQEYTDTWTDEQGGTYVVTSTYTPSVTSQLGWGGINYHTAKVATWTHTVKYYAGVKIMEHGFTYDLSKSGSQWKISNPRKQFYSGAFSSFSDDKLGIYRAVSTSTYPAEAYASVYHKLVPNAVLPDGVVNGTRRIDVSVYSSGNLKVLWK